MEPVPAVTESAQGGTQVKDGAAGRTRYRPRQR
jgi:hypothetical protein